MCENMKSNKIAITFCLFNANIDYYFEDCWIEDKWHTSRRVMILEHEFSSHRLELIFSDDHEIVEIAEFLNLRIKCQESNSLMPITTMN